MASVALSGGNRIRREDDNTISPTGGISLSCWFYATQFNNDDRMWFMNNVTILHSQTPIKLRAYSQGTSSFAALDNVGDPDLVINTPLHIVVTLSPPTESAQGNLYMNGVLIDTETVTTLTADTGVHIGENNAVAGTHFTGEAADFRVYDRVLSADEVATMYACQGMDGITRDLALRWVFNEKPPGTVYVNNDVKELSNAIAYTVFMQNGTGTNPSAGDGNIPVGYRRRRA